MNLSAADRSRPLSARQIAVICHDVGQYLHVHGLCSSAIDRSAIAAQELALIEQMEKSAQAIETLIRLLHELATLLASKSPPTSQTADVYALLRQLVDRHPLAMRNVRFCPPAIPTCVSTSLPLLYRLLKFLIEYSLYRTDACDISCRTTRHYLVICRRAGSITKHASSAMEALPRDTCRQLARSIGASLAFRHKGPDNFGMFVSLPLPAARA